MDYLAVFILWLVQFALIYVIAFRIFNADPVNSALITWMITTFSIMLMGLNAMSNVMARINNNHQKEIDKLEEEKINLNNKIRDCEDTINRMEQTRSFVPEINSNIALTAFYVSKSGYVVQQEKLETLKNHPKYNEYFKPKKTVADRIPIAHKVKELVNEAVDDWKDKGNWQVFYVGKHLNKYSIGIKLENVKYKIDEETGIVSFYKLELTPLDSVKPKPEELEQALKDAITHTWIIDLNNQNDTCKIINDNDYTGFKKEYVKQQGLSVEKSIEDEIKNLCKEGTKGLKKLLEDVYKGKIELIDKIEGEDEGWYPLLGGEGNPQIAARVIADLVIVLKAIELYTSKTEGLDRSLIPEKASA